MLLTSCVRLILHARRKSTLHDVVKKTFSDVSQNTKTYVTGGKGQWYSRGLRPIRYLIANQPAKGFGLSTVCVARDQWWQGTQISRCESPASSIDVVRSLASDLLAEA